MDVEKKRQTIEYELFGKVILKITSKVESQYRDDIEPIYPVVEMNLNEKYNNN